MAPMRGDGSALDSVLSAAEGGAAAVLLRGPAASGKTTAALGLYEHFSEAHGPGSALLLAPNAPAAADLRRRLLRRSPAGVVVSPHVMTFSTLAGAVLAAGQTAAAALTPFRRSLLLRRIVSELGSANKLGPLAGVADTPGLATSLDAAIAELKRAAAEPEALAKAITPNDAKARGLLEVYAEYQRRLNAEATYDVEGRMWLARDVLRAAPEDAPPPGLAGLRAAVAEGFTDFTPTQLEILALLAPRLDCVLLTLPFAEDGRTRMWRWAERTRESIRRAFGDGLTEIETARAGRPTFAAIFDRVFAFDAPACELPANVELIAAPDVDAEVTAVAARVKRLLLQRPGERAAVLARSLDAYREPLERIFRNCDIPVGRTPRMLTEAPIVRFLLDAAGMAGEFAFRDVLRVVTSSYFDPGALGNFDAECVAAAEMIIREGNVLGGREAYADAAKRLASRPTDPTDPNADVEVGPLRFAPQTLERAAEMLDALFGCVTTHPPAALSALAAALGLPTTAAAHDDPQLAARDLRALAALEAALNDAEPAPTSLTHLREALAAVTCPAVRGEQAVDFLDLLDARALRWDHVFLLGLSEGVFPRRLTEGALIGEAQRSAWADRGVRLDRRDDLTAREMLLFYLAASRADESLTLSHAALDAADSPAGPSAFLEALLEPTGGMEAENVHAVTTRIQAGRLVPKPDELCSTRDALNAVAAGMFTADAPEPGSILGWAAREAKPQLERLSADLFALAMREAAGAVGPFDGRLGDSALQAECAERFGPAAVFSATQLGAYGQCPWRFFASNVLALRPLREPQRRLEPQARGIFCHRTLYRVMTRLRDEAGGPVRLADVDEPHLIEVLDAAVAELSAEVEKQQPPYPALWRVQREQMRDDLAAYLRAERAQSRGAAIHFELAFADDRHDDEADPASVPGPVPVATPAGDVLIRGRIDRVDSLDESGDLLVIDYKTGGLPSSRDLNEGRNVQMFLYARAAERILERPCAGGVFQRLDGEERHFSKVPTRRGNAPSFDERISRVAELVGRFVERIRAGRFDAAPTHDCPRYCPYRQVCQWAKWRAERIEREQPEGGEA